MSETATLYERDFVAWAEAMAGMLRAGKFSDVDVEHVAEEIESLAGNNRRELQSRMAVLIQHLLKWRYQPERRSRSWALTIATQRTSLQKQLRESPSLRQYLKLSMQEVFEDGRRLALIETGFVSEQLPLESPFSEGQILDQDFLPEA